MPKKNVRAAVLAAYKAIADVAPDSTAACSALCVIEALNSRERGRDARAALVAYNAYAAAARDALDALVAYDAAFAAFAAACRNIAGVKDQTMSDLTLTQASAATAKGAARDS
jgi:hypothetical protein